ncbi:HET-domain-containing protein [Hyaloscypha hepaticicola]|uniref:HET-domain-containing protein n=1 Tax=Hyaloscypha hepaticicola TaxID=2082293 RepID=A0A2J6PYH9_9HELO|nr:HET-domain-containing protein [Hyaloscypha hepaticicola]
MSSLYIQSSQSMTSERPMICNDCIRTLDEADKNYGFMPFPKHMARLSTLTRMANELPVACHLCAYICHHIYQEAAVPNEDLGVQLHVDKSYIHVEFLASLKIEFAETVSTERVLPGDQWLSNIRRRKLLFDVVRRQTILPLSLIGTTPLDARNTSSSSCQILAKSWMNVCKTSHATCNHSSSSWYPTRLLDLRVSSQNSLQLRLIHSASTEVQGNYITLSHCWGNKIFRTLTTSNIADMESGIFFKDLPKLFQEAIQITRWFGVEYLWIDSYCIIQDSPNDWRHESAMMGKVYKHALLNISADMASNSSETCFADRNPMSFQPFPLNLLSKSDTYLVPESAQLLHTLNFSPLARRAWVVQERVLAPRVLHFTSQQLIWECGEFFACETYPGGMPATFDHLTPKRYMSRLSVHRGFQSWGVRQAWDYIIRDYSRCFLTKPEDKLVALSGIAKEFQSRIWSDKYLAGLWEADLYHTLLWHVDSANRSNFPSSRPAFYRAPTWSWLSIDGPVSPASEQFFYYHWSVIDADVSLKGEDPTGEVKAGSIKLRGLLRPVSLPRRIGAGLNSRRIAVDGEDMLFDDSIEYIEDVLDESPQEDGFVLLIRSYRQGGVKHLEGLVLKETEEQNTYRRLGWFCAHSDSATLAMRYKLRPGGPRLGNPWAGLFASRGDDGNGSDGELDELEAEQNNIYDLDPDHDTRRFERLREASITIV